MSEYLCSSHIRAAARLSYATWIALGVLFLFAGVIGHDPWKQDETYSFGIIYHLYTSHSWLVPMNAGMPFMEKPPLYYWTAALLCRVFSGVLPLPDAARIASVFYMLVSSGALWLTSQILFAGNPERRQMGCMTLAVFLGSFGVARHAHDMFTDTALLAGAAISLLGAALLIYRGKQWLRAGAVLGVGIGITFMSKGLLVPAIFSVAGIALIIFLPQLRTGRMLLSLAIALAVASPFLLIWPWLLYEHSPALFFEWLWDNNIGRFMGSTLDRLGAANSPGYMAGAFLWFCFPASLLALATLIIQRRQWRQPHYLLPVSILGIGLLLMLLSASARALYLLPLLPAAALLAPAALQSIPAQWLLRWNKAICAFAASMLGIVFVLWLSLLHPEWPLPLVHFFGGWLPFGFMLPNAQCAAGICSIILVLLWAGSFRLDMSSPLHTAYIWFASVAMIWGTTSTLLMPWIDEVKSYRPAMSNLVGFVNQERYESECIARYNVGESVAPMWQYFGQGRGMGPLIDDMKLSPCRLVLTLQGSHKAEIYDPHWHVIWKGERLLGDKDQLRLYERND